MVKRKQTWNVKGQTARLTASLGVLATVLAGCFGDGPQSTIRPESDSTRVIQDVYALVTWISAGIFVIVAVLLVFAIWRYRARDGERGIPKQTHGNTVLELIWTIIPAIILIFIAVPTWSGIFRAATPPTEDALVVEAIGHQWWWEFRYPDGTVTANEFHVPVGQPVVVNTHSVDVIHSFWLPRLASKIDSLPGKSNTLWFTPEQTGTYYGQCAEFCGTSHANMRFRVMVDTEEDYLAWRENLQLPPVPQTADAAAGEKLFTEKGCNTCHTIEGVPGAVGTIGPNLTNLQARTSLASAIMENTHENLADWIQNPQENKPGALMILPRPVNDAEASQIAAYLTSPPGEREFTTEEPGMLPASAVAGAEEEAAPSAQQVILNRGCGACHIIPGIPSAVGEIGPTLAGVASKDTLVNGMLENTPENMARWLENPPAIKSDTQMPNLSLSEQEIATLVEFLNTLE